MISTALNNHFGSWQIHHRFPIQNTEFFHRQQERPCINISRHTNYAPPQVHISPGSLLISLDMRTILGLS